MLTLIVLNITADPSKFGLVLFFCRLTLVMTIVNYNYIHLNGHDSNNIFSNSILTIQAEGFLDPLACRGPQSEKPWSNEASYTVDVLILLQVY